MPNINFNMTVSAEMLSKWCAVKGYQAQITGLNEKAELDTVDNPESEIQFFQRVAKIDLLGICVEPLENMIKRIATATAEVEVSTLRDAASEAMTLTVKN